MTAQHILKKTARVLGYTVGGIVVLLIAVVIFLNTGYAKRLIASKVQAYLSGKIKTKVTIGSINYKLPEWIQIEDVYIEDQKSDTLLYSGRLAVSISMLKLIHGETDIHAIELDSVVANVSRTATDSNYNFQFIIDAFASPKTAKKDTSASKITISKISVSNFALKYNDAYGGQRLITNIKELDLAINKFQPDQFHFELDKIKMDSSSILFATSQPGHIVPKKMVTVASAAPNPLNISIATIELNNDNIAYDDNTKIAQAEGLDPSHLSFMHMQVNVSDVKYNKDSILAVVKQLAFKEKSGFILDTMHARIAYSDRSVSAVELYIKTPQSVLRNSIEMQYDSLATIMQQPKRTKISAQLDHTTIALNDIYTLMPSVKKQLDPARFRNNVINIDTKISGSLQELDIPTVQVTGLSGTTFNAKATLYNITDEPNLAYNIYVFNSSIEKKDLLKFLPANSYVNNISSSLSLSTHAIGNLKAGTVDVNISGKDFSFVGHAIAKNIGTNALQYNIHIAQARVEKQFLLSIAPPNSIPSSIDLPQTILLKGDARGDMNNIEPDLVMSGSYGVVTAKGYIHNFKNQESATYNLQLTADNFQAGHLLKQDSVLGPISLTASAKGQGFNYKTMHADLGIQVSSANIKQYDYKDMSFAANLNEGNITSNGSIVDSNLKFHYTVAANIAGQYPTGVNALLVLDTFYAQKLHLYPDTLNASFKAVVKAPDLDPKRLDLYALVDSINLNLQNRPYTFDSIMAKATTENEVHTVVFRSPIADIDAKGKFDYDKIGASVTQYINRYYKITGAVAKPDTTQQIAFSGVIKNNSFVTDLEPGLSYNDIHFNGNYAASYGDSALAINVLVPKFVYNTNVLDNGKVAINSANGEIAYNISADAFRLNKQVFYGTTIKGDLGNDSINIVALTKDHRGKDWYGLAAAISSKDNTYTISLKDPLLLNFQKWKVSDDNKITYSKQGIMANDFLLQNNQSKIDISSRTQTSNSPIDITIDSFDIRSIASIMSSDTLLASGTINGKIEVSNLEKTVPSFTGTINIDRLQFKQQPIGDVKFYASLEDNNTVKTTVDIGGKDNVLSLKGSYYLNNTDNQFDLDLDITKLSMATLQTFTAGNISRASGNLDGKIKLNGNFNEPHWNGYLNFDTAKFTIVKTGAGYSITNQKIAFNYPVIKFSDFVIRDSAKNYLSLDGSMTAESMTSYDLSMNLYADNFSIINTARAIDNQMYGHATINTDVNIAGTTDAPNIEGDISLNRKSDVTLVLPEQNIDKDAGRTVVRFIDMDTFKLAPKPGFSPLVELQKDLSQFTNYNLNININKDAAVTVIIDPATGDAVKVQGDAELNAGVDPGGHIVLAGAYNLTGGYYIMNYKFLQRQFNIQDSSTIIFSGSPTDATIDITAEYTASCAPADLLENEVAGLDPKTAATFNQKIPFRVLLHLKGSMKKPDISFDIQLPDESSNLNISSDMRSTIENKLAQVRSDAAVTNKEVFSLLLLGHFVGEQSTDFFKGNGTSNDEVLKESVSSFLSTALNQVASDLVKGVDVNVNLNSYQDYTTGIGEERTDLDVAVSKNFINDRLNITAGKNFGVAGQDAATQAEQQNTDALPDITATYKLTETGRYSLKAYKKDQFEETLNGYITQTGVGFLFTMDYDKFKELFKKKDKKQKQPVKNE